MAAPNYFEYYMFTDRIDKFRTKTDLGKEKFCTLLEKFATSNIKYFQKQYKEYHYGNVVYQNFNNDEIKVTKTTPLESINISGCLRIGSLKEKLNIINIPSNANVDVVYYVKHLIYRFSSRIYLNMVVKKDLDGHESYTIFINYNHDHNVDTALVNDSLKKIFKLLSWEPTSEIFH